MRILYIFKVINRKNSWIVCWSKRNN